MLSMRLSAFDPQLASSIVTTRIARVVSICETSTVALNASAARH